MFKITQFFFIFFNIKLLLFQLFLTFFFKDSWTESVFGEAKISPQTKRNLVSLQPVAFWHVFEGWTRKFWIMQWFVEKVKTGWFWNQSLKRLNCNKSRSWLNEIIVQVKLRSPSCLDRTDNQIFPSVLTGRTETANNLSVWWCNAYFVNRIRLRRS